MDFNKKERKELINLFKKFDKQLDITEKDPNWMNLMILFMQQFRMIINLNERLKKIEDQL